MPFLTNCDMGPCVPHRAGKYTVTGIVGQYQLTLQHKEEQRFSAWYKAVNGMMLRFATVNVFSTCHNLKLAHGGDTLFDWQWGMMRYMSPHCPDQCPWDVMYPNGWSSATTASNAQSGPIGSAGSAMCISTWSLRLTTHCRRRMYVRGCIGRGGQFPIAKLRPHQI